MVITLAYGAEGLHFGYIIIMIMAYYSFLKNQGVSIILI